MSTRAVEAELRRLAVDDDGLHLAVELGRRVEERLEPLAVEACSAGPAGRSGRSWSRVSLPLLRERRREELGVPALARADSSTVIVGLKPKNSSVSSGWRYLSRSALPGRAVRSLPSPPGSRPCRSGTPCSASALAAACISGVQRAGSALLVGLELGAIRGELLRVLGLLLLLRRRLGRRRRGGAATTGGGWRRGRRRRAAADLAAHGEREDGGDARARPGR